MSYFAKEQEIQQMIGQGQLLEAFEKFYGEDIVMVEASGESFSGKTANRTREEDFVASLEEVHGGGVHKITANEEEGTTMAEVWIDATFKGGHRAKMEQVSVKQWKGDQVVHERFYYNMPPAQ